LYRDSGPAFWIGLLAAGGNRADWGGWGVSQEHPDRSTPLARPQGWGK
jgi:hypothetical protein